MDGTLTYSTYEFRPLAGFWFLNYLKDAEEVVRDLIPSPCGVLVLKCSNFARVSSAAASIPSPCGVLVLKCKFISLVMYGAQTIPSPCGVLVLKFEALVAAHEAGVNGFRPLAGFWFLNE